MTEVKLVPAERTLKTTELIKCGCDVNLQQRHGFYIGDRKVVQIYCPKCRESAIGYTADEAKDNWNQKMGKKNTA